MIDLPELTFNDERHEYRVNSVPVWSVSHYLTPITMQVYKTIDKAMLEKAAERGTSVHFAVELYNQYRVADVDEVTKPYLDAYIAWFDEYKPEILGIECRTYHPLYWYAGTADILCRIDGKIYVIDVKATAELKSFLVSVQLSAYAKSFIQHGTQVERIAALHLKKDGKYTFEEYGIEENFTRFLGCMDLQNFIDKNAR